MRRIFKLALTLMFLLTSSYGCLPVDYVGDLPNGYKVGKNNSTSISIFSTKDQTGFSKEYITRMNVRGSIVFGKIETIPPEPQRRVVGEKRHPGYFILNTETGLYQLGLERQNWLKELRKVGILEEPTLIRPSAFRNEPALVTMLKAIILGKR